MTDILAHRETTHGDFAVTAEISQRFKTDIMAAPMWHHLCDAQREAITMIATKLSRILSGDPQCVDHWEDIAGYATLAVRSMK